MLSWPRRPIIYEINTVVWLQELSRRERKLVTLGTVPTQEWDALALYGFDAVWLMGVWERSPAGIRIAKRELRTSCRVRTGAIGLSTGGQRRICLLCPSVCRGRSTWRAQRLGGSQKDVGRSRHAIDP